jgi:hypothetical protein
MTPEIPTTKRRKGIIRVLKLYIHFIISKDGEIIPCRNNTRFTNIKNTNRERMEDKIF